MAAKLTRLTHKIVIQLHLVAESCTICSSRSRRPVQKLLDTPSYNELHSVPAFELFDEGVLSTSEYLFIVYGTFCLSYPRWRIPFY
jgi:hypothetical protein